MSETPKYQNTELRNTIVILLDYFKELFRKWYVHLLFLLIFCGIAYYTLSKKEVKYEAKMSFMTNDGGSGSSSGLLRMANSFGLNMGGGSSAALSAEKLAELLISNRMLKMTFLQNIELKGKEDLFINHFEQAFSSNPSKITLSEAIDKNDFELFALSTKDHSVLANAIDKIKKSGLNVSISKNGIVRVGLEMTDELFTQKFLTKLVNNLSDFYSAKTVQQQQETNDMLSSRVDSLNSLLQNKEASLRNWLTKYTLRMGAGSLTPDEFLTKSKLEREAEIASNLYKESIQAYEMSKIDLDSAKPIIQIIDYPALPLEEKVAVPWVFYAAAIIAALFISSVLIIFAKLIRDALNYENIEN